MKPQIKSPVVCPECGKQTVLGHPDLDRRLENNEEIEVMCFANERHKWKLSAEERTRIKTQRKEQLEVDREK